MLNREEKNNLQQVVKAIMQSNLEIVKAQKEMLENFMKVQRLEMIAISGSLKLVERNTFFGGIQYGFKKLLRRK